MAVHDLAEEWRAVEGFPGYEVSSFGRVRSWRKNGKGGGFRDAPRVFSPATKRNGYLQLNLWRDGERSTHTVHKLVAITFIGPCPKGHECRHLDGDKLNCRVGNLSWGTPSQNAMDNVSNGVHPGFKIRGTAHHHSVLNELEVAKIKEMAQIGRTTGEIARSLGIAEHLIKSVRLGYSWQFGHGRKYGDGHFSKPEREERARTRAARGLAIGKGGTAKLSAEVVLAVREMAKSVPQNEVAMRYKLSKQHVSAIVTRRTWKHI